MRLRTLWTVISFVLLTSLWGGSQVRAQDAASEGSAAAPADDAKKKASAHFRRGVELFQESAYRAALVEFEKAYSVAPDYRLLYNIGQTKLQIQDYLGATQSYERYLTEGGGDVPSARREDVEKQLEALRERVGRIAINVNKEGAEVFVDDLKVGVTPMPGTVSVNVGRHRVLAQTADGATATQVIDVAGGEMVELKLELKAPEVRERLVEVNRGDAKPMPLLRKVAIGSWAAGGALAIGSLITGVTASGDQDDLDKALDSAPVDPAKVKDLRDSADTMALTTDVLAGLAIAAAAAGVVCWFMADDESGGATSDATEASVELGMGPTSLFARGRF